MANPAELLHAQLVRWNGPNNVAAWNTRNVGTGDGWDDHRRAVGWLDDLDKLLTIAETDYDLNMGPARRHYYRWVQMVFAYPNGWNTAGQHSIDATALEQLEATAATLQTIVPAFIDGGPEGFASFLDVLRARVDDICGEGEFLRKHAHRIINHLHGLLNDREHLEEFRITNAIDDLMLIIEELKKQRPEDPFLKRAATWTWTFFKKNVAVVYVSGIAITALPNADEVLEFVAREVHAITAGEEHAADAADDAETDADGAP